MSTIETTILSSIIGGLGLLITLLVLANGYRSNHQYQRQVSVRERYIALMNASPLNEEWVDPDFLDDQELEMYLQMIGK